MENIYIIGTGMIRFNKYPDRDVRDMAHEVIGLALDDAGLTKGDLEAGYFSNTFWGMFDKQHCIRGQVVFRSMGIDRIPVTNVENACAGASTALHLAYTAVRAQMCDVAIAVGSEKITNPDAYFKGAHHPDGRLLQPDESIEGVSVMILVPWMCDQLGIPSTTFYLGRGFVVKELCRRLNEHLDG